MRNSNLKLLVINGLLAATGLILGLTPLGYIPIGPIKITLMCIPVIIATLLLGLKSGLFMGAIFAFTSIMQILLQPSPLYAVLLTSFLNWVKILLVCVLPRLLIPVVTHLVHIWLHCRKKALTRVICSGAATLTNTIFFLGLFYLLFNGDVQNLAEDMQTLYYGMFATALGINAVVELALCCIVCPPIVYALSYVYDTGSRTAK